MEHLLDPSDPITAAIARPLVSPCAFGQFALERHADDRYGVHGFDYHLYRVVAALAAGGASAAVQAAGWGHDLPEMKRATLHEIRGRSNQHVELLVWAVTGIGINRAERLVSVLPKIPQVEGADELKTADRLGNMLQCLADERWGLLSVYVREQVLLGPVLAPAGHPLRRSLDATVNLAVQCLSQRHRRVATPPRGRIFS